MKNRELKKLSKEFSEFISESKNTNVAQLMSEFWALKFRSNNKEQEVKLFEYWRTH